MWYYNGLDVCEYATAQHEHHKYPTVYLVSLYKIVFLCFAHYSCMGTTYSLPSTSMVVLMPQARVYVLGSSCLTLRSLLVLDLRYLPVLTQSISSSVYGIMIDLCFTLIYMLQVKKYTVKCARQICVILLGTRRRSYVSYAVLLPLGSHTATLNCFGSQVCATPCSWHTVVHLISFRSCLTNV